MKTIGRFEKVALPELDIFDIDAKIDTGADASAIHCEHIRIDEKNQRVSFYLLDPSHPSYHHKSFNFPIHKIKTIKSSNGTKEERVSIRTRVRLGDKTYLTSISLANRESMKYPMLIGKRYLSKRFLVDVSQKYIGNIL